MPNMLTAAQVAARLGVDPSSIRRWAPRWPGAIREEGPRGAVWYIPEEALTWWYAQDHKTGPKRAGQ